METLKDITNSSSAVMIYFFSPGCSACSILHPKVKELVTSRFPMIRLYEIDASENPMLTAEAMVFAAPGILVYFEGKEYMRESKYISVDQLGDRISRYYKERDPAAHQALKSAL